MGNLLTRLPEVENDNARLQLELREERLKGAAPAASAGQPSARLPLAYALAMTQLYLQYQRVEGNHGVSCRKELLEREPQDHHQNLR